jgi:hypothetical protein
MTPLQRKAKSVEMKTSIDHPGAVGGFGRRLRRPHLLIPVAIAAAVAAVAVSGAAARQPSLAAPKGLQTFQLRKNDRSQVRKYARGIAGYVPTFSRTPAFAWTPVRGATRYEFELSTSRNFRADNAVIWSSRTLTTPAAAVPISLPWITGDDASLYWHVRALSGGGVSAWSAAARFNMRWPDVWNRDNQSDVLGVPQPLSSEPGYIKWTPVEGATGYQVWFWNLGQDHELSVGKIISTVTTVADEREFVTGRTPGSNIRWRVRARRELYGKAANGLPRASYGPWSQLYAAPAGEVSDATSPVAVPLRTVSSDVMLSTKSLAHPPLGVVSTGSSVRSHTNMPVFVFSRDGYAYHRVYVSTDRDCVNIVFRGSAVSGTAFAPRISGPLSVDQWDPTHSFLVDGDEGKALTADGATVTPNEAPPSSSGTAGSSAASKGPARVDLWDSNWNAGRYYWTVVPVVHRDGSFQDIMLPQDACQLDQKNVGGPNHMAAFRKKSVDPRLGDGTAPFVTGLSPSGRLMSAMNRRSRFYGAPLVSWQPASGAVAYDVQVSRTRYPWRTVGSERTHSTSAMLPLRPGTWWYRVRGINPYLVGNTKMSWSSAVRIRVAKPTFTVAGG